MQGVPTTIGPPSRFHAVAAGDGGALGAACRLLLTPLSWLYGAAVAVRNRQFDRPGVAVRAGVPVISVGNVTVGGTGKTPMVSYLVQRLAAMGRRPGVAARGYGAGSERANDEQRVIERQCPGIAYAADPDRVAAARRLVDLGVDVIVLDDGFQHRRLARDLDIVLIDATCPFGYGRLLPRGLLREPVSSLRRAHLIAITRADQAPAEQVERLVERLKATAPEAAVVRCRHAPTGLCRLDGSVAEERLEALSVYLCAGIAHPAAFVRTVESTGARVIGVQWWPDHHRYTAGEVRQVIAAARSAGARAVLTTEKDAVKLTVLGISGESDSDMVRVLRVAIAFAGNDAAIVDELLRKAATAT